MYRFADYFPYDSYVNECSLTLQEVEDTHIRMAGDSTIKYKVITSSGYLTLTDDQKEAVEIELNS